MKDYYTTLGIAKGASQDAIQKAFRTLAHKHHPDKKGGDVNRFKEINEAYQVLGNPEKRAAYDAGGSNPFANAHGFEGFDFSGANGFSDIFDLFRGHMNRGEDILIDITIAFEESVFGVEKKMNISYRRKSTELLSVPIPAGIQPGSRMRFQQKGEPSKDGNGTPGDLYIRIAIQQHPQFQRHGNDIVSSITVTPTEALLGVTKDIRDIRGAALTVKIPELSKEGTPIVFEGKGIPKPNGSGRLIVLCHIEYPKSISSKVRDLLTELQKAGW